MGITPLMLAGIASVALFAVIGVDVSMNETYYLEVHDGTTWQLLAQFPYQMENYARPYPSSPVIEANASEAVRFRLRVDNSYAWGDSDEYVVSVAGSEVARGVADVPARAQSTFEFTVNASRLMGVATRGEPVPVKDASGLTYATLDVRLDDDVYLAGTLSIKEVSA